MSEQVGSAAGPGPVWCPFCGAAIGDVAFGGEFIACDHCRRSASRELVLNASAWHRCEAQVTEYTAALHRQVAAMQRRAVHYDGEVVRVQAMARAARGAAPLGPRSRRSTRPPLR